MQHPFSQEVILPAAPKHIPKESELPIERLAMSFALLGVFVGIDEGPAGLAPQISCAVFAVGGSQRRRCRGMLRQGGQ
jgi:hypothetical protein